MTQIAEQPKDKLTTLKGLEVETLVRKQVMHALGTPADLIDVQVRKLWDNHYRVNVLIGPNIGAVRLVNSYFVRTDNEGSCIETTPKIEKQY